MTLGSEPSTLLDRSGYELEVEDRFDQPVLDERLWIPHFLPQWSSKAASAARFDVGGGRLRLRIDADQDSWNPELEPGVRVSSLQTGVWSGPRGSSLGQHHFRAGLTVSEEQPARALYTPMHGLFELRARATAERSAMVALWMIGFEDQPTRSAEICVMEIFGRDVSGGECHVGMGVHPFGDPAITDEFSRESLAIDATRRHEYAAQWTSDWVAFYVDERLAKVVRQSPAYPMQVMLSLFDFADTSSPELPAGARPSAAFEVEWFRGWRRVMDGDGGRPKLAAAGDFHKES